ncbi:protein spinster homolog 1-like [Centruroides sculpturatus]|uniref:protein spinster homolog 1-like n=1 Tax=Centruroides sculpturatus TaxID=218467 RepID=UPI000C6EB2AF|nr:protein spinster homolog 1-like [Centruroides sculpturatus]
MSQLEVNSNVVKLINMQSSHNIDEGGRSENNLYEMPPTEIVDSTRRQISSSFGNVAGNKKLAFASIAILCFINLINYMDRYTVAGVLIAIQKFYNLNDADAGLIQTSFICSYMIFAPIFGYLGDRYSRKWLIVGGISFWSATTLLGSFIPKGYFPWFLALRALVGVGEASYSTVAPTIIADLFSKTIRTRVLALFYFAIPVGSGVGYIVGAKIANIFGHWYWALRATPILGLLAIILAILFLRDPPRGEAEGGVHLTQTSIKEDLLYLSKNCSFIWSTFGFTCVAFATGALALWAPAYMNYAISLNSKSVSNLNVNVNIKFGIITCVAGISGVLLGSGLSQYLRKFNERADPLVCAAGMLGSTPFVFFGCIVAAKYTNLSWTLIFFGEMLLCMNWAIVADMLLYVVIPTRRSIAAATQILISHALGDATSPSIIGTVSDAINYTNDKSIIIKYISLQYALFITTFVLVIGGFCFLITALYIVNDKKRCTLIVKGLNYAESSEELDSNQETPSCCPFFKRRECPRPIYDGPSEDVIT